MGHARLKLSGCQTSQSPLTALTAPTALTARPRMRHPIQYLVCGLGVWMCEPRLDGDKGGGRGRFHAIPEVVWRSSDTQVVSHHRAPHGVLNPRGNPQGRRRPCSSPLGQGSSINILYGSS